MVHRHLVVLAALLVQPEPPALALGEVVLDPHRKRRADPREAVDQDADERPIAKADQAVCRDALEQLMRFLRREDRRPAAVDDVARAPHHGGGVAPDDLADHQPVEQHAHRRQMLLDAGRRVRRPELLDVGGHMHGLEEPELGQPPALAPAEEVRNGQSIGLPGVAVADVGGEELDEAPGRGLAGGGYLRPG